MSWKRQLGSFHESKYPNRVRDWHTVRKKPARTKDGEWNWENFAGLTAEEIMLQVENKDVDIHHLIHKRDWEKEKQKRYVDANVSRWPENSVGRQVELQKIAASQKQEKLSDDNSDSITLMQHSIAGKSEHGLNATGTASGSTENITTNTTGRVSTRTSSLKSAGRQVLTPPHQQRAIATKSIPSLDSLGAAGTDDAQEVCVLCNHSFPKEYYFEFHLDECLKERRTLRPETVKSKNETVECPHCHQRFPEFLVLEHIIYCDERHAQLREGKRYSRARQEVVGEFTKAQDRLQEQSRRLFASQQRLKVELHRASTAGDLHEVHRVGRELRDVERACTAMVAQQRTQAQKQKRDWSGWKQNAEKNKILKRQRRSQKKRQRERIALLRKSDPEHVRALAAASVQSAWRGHTVRRDEINHKLMESTLRDYDKALYDKIEPIPSPPKSRFYRSVDPWVCSACQYHNEAGHCCQACGSSAWLSLTVPNPTTSTLMKTAANSVVYFKPEDLPLLGRLQALGRGFVQRTRTRRRKAATVLAYAWHDYVVRRTLWEQKEAHATAINTVARQFFARQMLRHKRREVRSATKIQSILRTRAPRRELQLQSSTAKYVQRHMRSLLVRRRLDNQNFAAYKIQGWYRQYRHDRFEKIMYRTKQVAKRVMAATIPKAKTAFQKAGAFFKNLFKAKAKDKAGEEDGDAANAKPKTIFQKVGNFFANLLKKKKKKSSASAGPESVDETFQRRLRDLGESKTDEPLLGEAHLETKITESGEHLLETKITEPRPPASKPPKKKKMNVFQKLGTLVRTAFKRKKKSSRAAARRTGRFRAAARKVGKPTAFQKVGSFFKNLFKAKAKAKPDGDDAKKSAITSTLEKARTGLSGLGSSMASRFKRLQDGEDSVSEDDDDDLEREEEAKLEQKDEHMDVIDLKTDDEFDNTPDEEEGAAFASIHPEPPASPSPPPSPSPSPPSSPRSSPLPSPSAAAGGPSARTVPHYLADAHRADAGDDDDDSEQRWAGRRRGLRGFSRQQRGVAPADGSSSEETSPSRRRRRRSKSKGFQVKKRRIHLNENFKNNIEGRGFARAIVTSNAVRKVGNAMLQLRTSVKRNLKVDLRSSKQKAKVHPMPF